ncbi:cache domain-containing sensor histidine kinase [Paenibacillus apis]|uniref:Sensor histidine kinase YesM n=1 Tax=Paenibacillus apis TaxID=1792174 RepID=A0A919Y3Y5_9BACL|nr:sensor histidine kinase [Paenibacillus apis]GIO43319.1 sensor histidine kinase YesM [Paenibacillus apis]
MKLTKRIGNLSLRKKLIALLAAVGIGPLIFTFFLSYGELRNSVLNNQHYAANQNFTQSLTMLSSKFTHIEEISSMIMIDEDINAVFSSDPGSMAVWEQLAKFDEITEYTNILKNDSEYEDIVYYIDGRFVIAAEDAPMYRPLESIENETWAQKILSGGGESVWVLVPETDERMNARKYLTLGRILWNSDNYSEPVGLVTIRMNPDSIRQYLSASIRDQLVYLETADGELIVSNRDDKLSSMRLPSDGLQQDIFKPIELPPGDYLARSMKVGSSNLYLRSVISQQALSEDINVIRNQMLVTYLIISTLLLMVIFPVTRSITSRIFMLMNKMTQVRQGRLNTLDIEPREDEVGHLISSYNYMINSVRELMDEQFRLGQEKLGAELKALQSQINPHFLYNTLDMIVWMAQKDERRNLQEVVYSLSDYYKLILNKGEDFVTVEDELRLCLYYMEIQQKRYKGRIVYEVEVEEETLGCLLPKITLQPLVENAIVHGILENDTGYGKIKVKGRLMKDRLVLEVEDDGPGMKGNTGRRVKYQGSGYGTQNIGKRLELYFGEPNGIRFADKEKGRGTRVIIDVPIVCSK